jgi:anaerobic magnesium-protoporphyrin IX monomethyl ester cyclase
VTGELGLEFSVGRRGEVQGAAVRVLLIDPPFYRLIGFYNRYFPLGLVSVGTALREAGHEVVVYDADYNEKPSIIGNASLTQHYQPYMDGLRQPEHPIWREVRETSRQVRPEVVGIGTCTAPAASAFRVAEISKAVNPGCPVIVGGPHATVKADEVLRLCPAVDYVVRGEGEITAIELIRAMAGSTRTQPVEGILGVSHRAGVAIRHNPPRERIKNLDELAPPDRGLLVHRAVYSSEDMGLVMTSRGCPFACSFCATDNRQVRYRSIEHILREIRHVKATYGTTQFSFKDDSFTVNKSRVAEFCDALTHEGLRIGWECNTRVDLVNEPMLRQMKRAGCNSVKVGIESGSPSVLERMNKGITLDQIRQAAELFRKVGLYWTGYFLIGTPGETTEDVYRTLDFLYMIRPDFASVGVYEPFPGTAMFEEGIRRSLVQADMVFEDFYRMMPNDYYKADPRRQVDTMDGEAFDRLASQVKARFHAYNKGPVRLFKRAKSRAGLYLSQPTTMLADVRKYFSWC